MARGVLLVIILVTTTLAAGFLAGRKLPPGLGNRVRHALAPNESVGAPPAWTPESPAPFQVFEAATATVNGALYVFGGLADVRLHATASVWRLDPSRWTWQQLRDMPSMVTHADAVVVDGEVWLAGGFVGASPGPATADVWRYNPATDTWRPGPPLPAKRGGGGLAAVDKELHYFGGFIEDRETATADHWVLALAGRDSLVWKPAPRLPRARGHVGGAVVDGKIYAIGGCVGHDPDPLDVADVHQFDPVRGEWSKRASLPLPASHFEPSTFVKDGRIVVIGGRSRPRGMEALNLVIEYDPKTDRWTALPALPERRHSPVAAAIPGGMIVGAGGTATSNPNTREFFRYHDSTTWFAGDALPVALGEVAAGIIDDHLYVVGEGAPWTLALDLRSGRWVQHDLLAVRPAPGNHHAAEVWNGKLYLFGGLRRGQGTVQVYDPAVDEWRMGPKMPFASGSSATARVGGFVYVAGGIIGDTTTRMAARFDLTREGWSPIPPMPRARNHTAAGTDGVRFFIFGGRGPGSGNSNVVANGFDDVQIYDPATNSWAVSGEGADAPARLPQARGGTGKAVYFGGEFWVFGGETLDGPGANRLQTYGRVDVYDPRTNKWRVAPALPTPRHGIFPITDRGRIYVLGGGTKAGHSASATAEILFPRAAVP